MGRWLRYDPESGLAEDPRTAADHWLAQAVQAGGNQDRQVVEAVVERYGGLICRYVYADLVTTPGLSYSPQLLADLVSATFVTAFRQMEHYQGESSLRAWLLKVARQSRRKYQVRGRAARLFKRAKTHADRPRNPLDPAPEEEPLVQALATKPPAQRQALLLGYLADLELAEIAFILGRRPGAVAKLLSVAHLALAPAFLAEELPALNWQAKRGLPRIFSAARWASILGEDDAAADLPDFAANPAGRTWGQAILTLGAQLRTRIWQVSEDVSCPAQELSAQIVAQLQNTDRSPGPRSWPSVLAFKELLWILGTVVVVALVGWGLSRDAPRGGQPLFLPTPFTVAENQPVQEVGTASLLAGPYPSFSAEATITPNGRWVVLTSSLENLVPEDSNGVPDVFVYDRTTETYTRISVLSSGEQADGWSGMPRISANGRWVTFASAAGNLAAENIQTCSRPALPDGEVVGNCVNIYLHDRELGTTELLTKGQTGQPVDGSSFNPVISGDGRWVAFWSQAENLTASGRPSCSVRTCADIYIYDRETQTLDRFPVGREVDRFAGQQALEISAAGRWLAYESYPNDIHSVGTTHSMEAVLYDREREALYMVNRATDGTPGNGASAGPQLSADGRTVAFVSVADNLVPGDRNERGDVFVHEVSTGRTERVSLSPAGAPWDWDSGLLPYPRSPWGQRLALSPEGRYVAFVAANQPETGAGRGACFQSLCHNLYIHDRNMGQTIPLERALAPQAFGHLPSLAAGGEVLAFTEYFGLCLPDCAHVALHERSNQQTQPLGQVPPGAPDPGMGKGAGEPPVSLWTREFALQENEEAVRALVFSPDSQYLATGSADGSVRLWRVQDGSLTHNLGRHTKVVLALAFSPDGQWLATGGLEGGVQIWRVPTGERVQTLTGGYEQVRSLAFSPDGRQLVVGGRGAVWFYKEQGGLWQHFVKHNVTGSYVHALAFSADGQWLALAPGDETVWVLHVAEGTLVTRLGGHTKMVRALAFSPQGDYLASGSADHTVNLWQLSAHAPGKLEQTHLVHLTHEDWVSGLAFSPDGQHLLTSSFDRVLQFWQLPEGVPLQRLLPRSQGAVYHSAIAPDGATLAAASAAGVQFYKEYAGQPGSLSTPRFFRRLVTNLFPYLQTWQPSIPLYEGRESFFVRQDLSLEAAQSRVEFEIRLPQEPPGQFTLDKVQVPAEYGGYSVVLSFEDTALPESQPFVSLILQQDLGAIRPGPEIASTALVESLEVAGRPAEYVSGGWDWAGSTKLESFILLESQAIFWNPSRFRQVLRWQDGEVIFTLRYDTFAERGEAAALSKTDLVRMAESIYAGVE